MKNGKRIIILVSIALLSVFSFFVDNSAISLMSKIKNPVFDYLFGWITTFGNIFVVLIFMTSLFLWEEKKREWIPALWASYGASIAFCFLIKLIVGRPRFMEAVLFPIIGIVDYSFPSMHATAAFAAIPILDREFPRFKFFWIFFALLVAFSRLYLNAHYLSDVVFGAILGYLVGYLVVSIEIKKGIFKKWTGLR